MRHGGSYVRDKPGTTPRLVERTREVGDVGAGLKPARTPAPVATTAGRPSRREARVAAIVAAMRALDMAEDANVTEGGKASATALTDILGWRVTVGERDEAWEAVTATVGAGLKPARTARKE